MTSAVPMGKDIVYQIVYGTTSAILVLLVVAVLILLPGGLLMGLLGPTVGKLFDRYGPRGLTILGATLLGLTMWQLSMVDTETR